jgi:hypothetical protein
MFFFFTLIAILLTTHISLLNPPWCLVLFMCDSFINPSAPIFLGMAEERKCVHTFVCYCSVSTCSHRARSLLCFTCSLAALFNNPRLCEGRQRVIQSESPEQCFLAPLANTSASSGSAQMLRNWFPEGILIFLSVSVLHIREVKSVWAYIFLPHYRSVFDDCYAMIWADIVSVLPSIWNAK